MIRTAAAGCPESLPLELCDLPTKNIPRSLRLSPVGSGLHLSL
jgi:hypothetical protein